jgi:flagellar capping protein FliD
MNVNLVMESDSVFKTYISQIQDKVSAIDNSQKQRDAKLENSLKKLDVSIQKLKTQFSQIDKNLPQLPTEDLTH